MTFSIVAWDPGAEPSPEWGVAVASKFLAVGAVVPWASAGAGAVATQALANVAYGPRGLELLARGAGADAVVAELTGGDGQRDHRQLGVVDAAGRAATHTGPACLEWAGGRTGDGYCCQGNILAGPAVVDRMCEAFESTRGDLATRLLAAIEAGDAAGGDARGRQSAALVVVRAEGSYGGGHDVALDLRVDDHPEPIPELARLVELHRVIFPNPADLEFVRVDDALARELRDSLRALGHDPGDGPGYDDALRGALLAYVGTENLEERWSDGAEVEVGVVEHVRRAAGSS